MKTNIPLLVNKWVRQLEFCMITFNGKILDELKYEKKTLTHLDDMLHWPVNQPKIAYICETKIGYNLTVGNNFPNTATKKRTVLQAPDNVVSIN